VDNPPELRNRYALSDADVTELARFALIIEKHYGRPMDIEWGKDGVDGQLYILQARPETVKSQSAGRSNSATSSRATAARSPVLAEGPGHRPEGGHRARAPGAQHGRNGPRATR
jgi:pyruvate,water dikinase